MSQDVELSHGKYHRLTELASRWKLDVRELLRIVLEQGIGVAILEFRGAGHDPEDSDDDEFPSWAVFVVPDVLKKIASIGEARVGGGARFHESEAIPVFFPERLLTAEDLIVLADAYAELANLVDVGANGAEQHELAMTPALRSTLLKQIAALAVLLSKEHQGFSYGGKPNSKHIAESIATALANWPPETWSGLDKGFFSKSKINDSIREGLKLIGFKNDSDSM